MASSSVSTMCDLGAHERCSQLPCDCSCHESPEGASEKAPPEWFLELLERRAAHRLSRCHLMHPIPAESSRTQETSEALF